MTRAQHALYRKELWPEACRVQGWDAHDEAKRRAVTLAAARKINPHSSCDSTANLNEDQITALFKDLIAYADPLNLDKARAAANPVETAERDRRGRIIHEIERLLANSGFHRNYVDALAFHQKRLAGVKFWKELPAERLKVVLITFESRIAKRPAAKRPRAEREEATTLDYTLRPRTTFQRPVANENPF